MTVSPWQRRIHRAQELAARHSFAAEILEFYVHVARFQEDLYRRLSVAMPRPAQPASLLHELGSNDLELLSSHFDLFLALAESRGPKALAELSQELRER